MTIDKPKFLNKVQHDINLTNKKLELLGKILGYYDPETGTFNVPAKWSGRVRVDKLPAKTPRAMLYYEMCNVLSPNELSSMGVYTYDIDF